MNEENKMTAAVKLRALILDDDMFLRELLHEMLHGLGLIEVLTESDGNQALQTVKIQAPNIVFCDINMPGMDGIEFLRHLAKQGYKGSLVLISGANPFVLKAVERLARTHGFNLLGSLEKPFDLNALAEMIARPDQLLKHHRNTSPKKLTAEELREGFALDRLVLFYQPKVAVYGWRVPDAECLARWQHPERGLLGPDAFIDVAEESGLISEFTQIVLRKAVTDLSRWWQNGGDFRLAINVSMVNLCQLDLPEVFEKIVRSKGLEPERFILEVTESRLVNNLSVTLDILTRLRLKGFGLSIDDFGTGYSTMESLMHLPFTELKLDRAFVHGAAESASARAILESSVRLGRALQLNLVAEGVENRDDWGVIAGLGCHEMQGYLVAKPMPADKLLDWVVHWESQTGKNSQTDVSLGIQDNAEQRLTILVIDDDDYTCEMFNAALSYQYRIVFARQGEEGLQLAQSECPALILLDVEMPGLDGYETCRQLKAIDSTAEIPVIFVSGHDLIEDRLKGYDAGGEDYFTKPFNPQELKVKVTHMLSMVSERVNLKDMANYASTTAMTAMTSMSELGALLETLKSFNDCSKYKALADAMLAGLVHYGLQGAVQIRAPQQMVARNHQGEASPLEVSIMENMSRMERIVQFKSRLSITYDHVSLLVNNLPKNDADCCGRLRDHLAMLVEAAEMRVRAISDGMELLRRSEAITFAVERIADTLMEVDAAQRQNQMAVYLAASTLKERMEKALLNIALSETEDDFLTSLIRDGIDEVLTAQATEFDIQDKLTRIVTDLKTLMK